MNYKALCLSIIIPLAIAAQTAQADAPVTIQQMAQILLDIKQKPSKEQIKTLEGISPSRGVTANEQRLAKAMLGIDGKLTDKSAIWEVLRSVNASEGERELAKILNSYNTKAAATEKTRLKSLLPTQVIAEKDAKKADKKVTAAADKKQ